jgi:hypothetical protein
MKEKIKKSGNLFLLFHLIFILITIIALLVPSFLLKIGIKLFILVLIYNLSAWLIGVLNQDSLWTRIWLFSFLISIFQVFPDWFLSAELNVLVFPEDGLFKIGPVSGYMVGLWTIPLFIIIYTGVKCKETLTDKKAVFIVLLLSLLIFGTSEATIWVIGSWYPQNVTTLFNHIALYIIPPELILGFCSYYIFLQIQNKKLLYYLPLSFAIMLIYLGSCSFFYFLIEKIVL